MPPERIRLTVRYDGTDFAGSQVQPSRRTVAGTLKTELESFLKQAVHLEFASRTDRGVHAEGNVCAFNARLPLPVARLPLVLNHRLPQDLRISQAQAVPSDFRPRFDAVSRTYAYRIYRGDAVPMDRWRYTAGFSGSWDTEQVCAGIQLLVGEHDFAAFCRQDAAARATHCNLLEVLAQEAGAEVVWTFTADRFLWHMVCRLAGALMDLAAGRLQLSQLAQALSGRKDFKLKPAPSKGLTLLRVNYS